jgi:hypothetical protein
MHNDVGKRFQKSDFWDPQKASTCYLKYIHGDLLSKTSSQDASCAPFASIIAHVGEVSDSRSLWMDYRDKTHSASFDVAHKCAQPLSVGGRDPEHSRPHEEEQRRSILFITSWTQKKLSAETVQIFGS